MTKQYAILSMDTGFYLTGHENDGWFQWTSDVTSSKKFNDGDELHDILRLLRKNGFRVTATDEEIGWR